MKIKGVRIFQMLIGFIKKSKNKKNNKHIQSVVSSLHKRHLILICKTRNMSLKNLPKINLDRKKMPTKKRIPTIMKDIIHIYMYRPGMKKNVFHRSNDVLFQYIKCCIFVMLQS